MKEGAVICVAIGERNEVPYSGYNIISAIVGGWCGCEETSVALTMVSTPPSYAFVLVRLSDADKVDITREVSVITYHFS